METTDFKWKMNTMPKSDDKNLPIMDVKEVEKAKTFHRSFPQYTETPLVDLQEMAKYLGLSKVCVKDESYRFGLNAFKVLGGSYAIGRHIADELGRDISTIDYNYPPLNRKDLSDLSNIDDRRKYFKKLNTKRDWSLNLYNLDIEGSSPRKFGYFFNKEDFIIAGYNFGCGSSREHAPIAIKASGIKAVIAKSFARIFYRNAINIGLVIVENDKIQEDISPDDVLELNLNKDVIKNITKNKTYSFAPYPAEIQQLIEAGGLVEYTKRKIKP